MSLSITRGDCPIANYKKNNIQKVIYLNDDNVDTAQEKQTKSKQTKSVEVVADFIEEMMTKHKISLSDNEIMALGKAIKANEKPVSPKLKNLFEDYTSTKKHTEIIIKDGGVLPCWNKECEREVFYIAGMSGSGKSVFASKLINNYKQTFKKNKVLLFSNKDEDPALDKEGVLRIALDDDLLFDQFELNDFRNKLIVFDDVEANKNKKMQGELDRLRDLILQQGRSYHCSFIYISHLLNDGHKTRTILNESQHLVVFPKYITFHALRYCLEKYFGMSKEDIHRLKKLPSRYACLSKFPQLSVIYDKGAYLIE
tara:strand:+ start:4531 stop:5466 length:936 start_codon:yes stop_codon:yes gene_type:complete